MEADRAGDENPFARAKERAKEIDRKNGSESEKVVDLANAVEDGNENEISRAQGRHFRLARTSDLLKECGLSGDFFTIRTGVVLRHHGKDSGHAISANEWVDISVALTERKPQLVERYGKSEKSYLIWTEAKIGGKTAIVGVDVKSVGMDMEVNSISTAFGASGAVPKEENIVYPKTKKEIQSVLTRHNSGRYPDPLQRRRVSHNLTAASRAARMRENGPVSAQKEAGATTHLKAVATESSVRRRYTREPIAFSKPFVGRTGSKLVGYEWPNEGEEYVDKSGNDRVRYISDWNYSEVNGETGRNIVHKFLVEMPDGERRTVSAESAAKLLGVSTSQVKGEGLKQIRKKMAVESLPYAQKAMFERITRNNKLLKDDDSVALMKDGTLRILGFRGKADGEYGRWNWHTTTISPDGSTKEKRL